MFAIAKRSFMGDNASYVTAVKRGGLSIDNVRIWDDRLPRDAWQVRKWPTADKAAAVLEKLITIGGFDDYAVAPLP